MYYQWILACSYVTKKQACVEVSFIEALNCRQTLEGYKLILVYAVIVIYSQLRSNIVN